MNSRKVALYGMFLAVAMVFSYIEYLLPLSIGIPGVKLGLANIVTMIALSFLGLPATIFLTCARILLTGFLFGSVFSILYSAAGASLSILVMGILIRSKKFSLIQISLAGGIAHNLGQILIASLLLESSALIYYLPILILAGLLAGILVGLLSGKIMNRLIPLLKENNE